MITDFITYTRETPNESRRTTASTAIEPNTDRLYSLGLNNNYADPPFLDRILRASPGQPAERCPELRVTAFYKVHRDTTTRRKSSAFRRCPDRRLCYEIAAAFAQASAAYVAASLLPDSKWIA